MNCLLKTALACTILFLICTHSFGRQVMTGQAYIKHYLPEDYGSVPQNWSINYDEKGRVFIGNTDGLLIFNGSKWQKVKGTEGKVVRTIGKDSKGIYYIGHNRNISIITTNEKGFLHASDISELIPKKNKKFPSLLKSITTDNAVYFISSKYIFKVVSPEKLEVIKKPPRIKRFIASAIFAKNNAIHTFFRDSLVKYENGQWVYQPNVTQPKSLNSIFKVMTHKNDEAYIISGDNKRLYVFKGSTITEIDISDNPQMKITLGSEVTNSKRYQDWFVFSTVNKGIFIFDKEFNLIQNIRKSNGLQTDQVWHLNIDHEGGVWCGTNRGIDYFDLKYPLTSWGKEQNLDNLVMDLRVCNDLLYVSTSDGETLYSDDFKTNEGFHETGFKSFSKIIGQSWYLSTLKDNSNKNVLSVGTRYGFFLDRGDHQSKLYGKQFEHIFELYPSKVFKNRVYLTYIYGTAIYEFENNQLILKGNIKNYKGWLYNLIERPSGIVWGLDPYKGLFRFDMNSLNPKKDNPISFEPQYVFFDSIMNTPIINQGLIGEFDDKLLFAAKNGLYYYDESKKDFLPYDGLNSNFKGHPKKGKSVKINRNIGSANNAWFLYNEDSLYSYNKTTKKLMYHDVMKKLKGLVINVIYDDEEKGRLWFGTSKGVSCYYYKYKLDDESPYKNAFSLITTKTDTLYGGHGNIFTADQTILNFQQGQNMTFQYSANTYRNSPDKVLYSYFLDGNDNEWSQWENTRKKEYTNLFEGNYVFRVKSKNSYGIQGETVNFRFEVNPPFYRTLWAYLLYLTTLILTVYLIVKWNTKRLKVENERLERVIDDRTSEITAQNEEIIAQNEEIHARNKDILQLSELGQNITECLSVDAILTTVYDGINMMMDAEVISIGEYNEYFNELQFSGIKDKSGHFLVGKDTLDDQNSIGVWCFKNRKEILINDLESEYKEYTNEIPDYLESTSLIYLPLLSKERILGVINVQSLSKNAYKKRHLFILKTLATYVATALDNTYAYNIIKDKNENITSSIRYAQTIQQALLPIEVIMRRYFSEHFVIFRPRDIVSGDFYWVTKLGDQIFIAVVDCTGHGVPGAFMSMIGNSLLNQIVKEKNIHSPQEILNELDIQVQKLLKQKHTNNVDGMDMGLCVLKPTDGQYKLTFSGAKSDLYYFLKSSEKIEILKGGKDTIGGVFEKTKVFTNHEVTLQKGDQIYLLTDGIRDQNNHLRKRFGTKRLIAILNDSYTKPMIEQKGVIENAIDEYQQNERQRDDITMLGVRV